MLVLLFLVGICGFGVLLYMNNYYLAGNMHKNIIMMIGIAIVLNIMIYIFFIEHNIIFTERWTMDVSTQHNYLWIIHAVESIFWSQLYASKFDGIILGCHRF